MKQEQMFLNAKWIDCPNGTESPIFVKKFEAKAQEKAEILICGLGFFELKINGRRVSDDLLVPNASNYSFRDMSKWSYPIFDEISFRTYVVKYDISDYLVNGNNELTVMLGGGYYHQERYTGEGEVSYGKPKLCFLIKKNSGNIISDKSTLCHKGFFERCHLYDGEYQDYTKVPKESDFTESREITVPDTELYIQTGPADKVTDTIESICLLEEKDGVRLYDIGKNIAGRVVMKCEKAGEYFKVEYAEQITGHRHWGMHFQEGRFTDEFVSDGIQKEYHSLFSWQGFRYFRVTGDAEPVRAEIIHSDCPQNSYFHCDNENLNWLYDTYIHTQLCNMHSGVPSDCPHRERLGYTGDGQLCCEAGMLLLDSKEFYRKWLYDISDCQNIKNGHIQHTAPFMGGGGGPCGWGGAIVEVPYKFYKVYGDKDLLEEFFPKMLRFFEYLESRCEFGLVYREEKGGWCLGDWLPPKRITIPETYVNTCLYVKFMKQVKEIAAIIGKENEVTFLDERIARSTKAINVAYYSDFLDMYVGDTDGASSLALNAGIAEEKVRTAVVKKYKDLGELDTGIIATLELIEYLYNNGEHNLATELLASNKEVSFHHMKESGATTIWENWNGDASQDHPMFGAVTKFLLTKILGIGQADGSCGFKEIVISPKVPDILNCAEGFINTVNGKISVSFKKNGNKTSFNVSVEPGRKARFIFEDINEEFTGERIFEA